MEMVITRAKGCECTVFDLSLHQLLIRVGACIVITSIDGFVLAAIAGLGDRYHR